MLLTTLHCPGRSPAKKDRSTGTAVLGLRNPALTYNVMVTHATAHARLCVTKWVHQRAVTDGQQHPETMREGPRSQWDEPPRFPAEAA